MQTPLFSGAGTALVTPFRDNALDLDTFDKLLERQRSGGVSALIVCGTTGEAATLSPQEHETLYRRAVLRGGGSMKIIAGIGSNDPRKAMDLALRAEAAGTDALLMVTPYYNKTTQSGLIKHFSYVADRSSLPVILYNVPTRTGVGIQPETYAALADHPNICGVKEASGDLAAFTRAKALCGDRLTFWSGNDSDTVAMMALGARGVISVASNLIPREISRLCRLCLEGDFSSAAELNGVYAELFHDLFREVNPIPVKTAMELMGLCKAQMRLPLVPMGDANHAVLEARLRKLGLIA